MFSSSCPSFRFVCVGYLLMLAGFPLIQFQYFLVSESSQWQSGGDASHGAPHGMSGMEWQPPAIIAYSPSKIESYFLDHGPELGFDAESPTPSGCAPWKNSSFPIAAELATFRAEMKDYHTKFTSFPGTDKDLRKHLGSDHNICDTLELHPQGLKGIFPSGSLTQTRNGLLEPIFPPLRDPEFCFSGRPKLLSLDYMVHDFASYCRSLTPTSRIVLFDMGAALDFHGSATSPAVYLTQTFERFGFHFDHIYAYEVKRKPPQRVFSRIPQDLLHAYHWVNVGVSHDPNSTMNPWNMLRNEYTEDDFVVVKLDIDTSSIEVPLAKQLLESPELSKLVDVFYFEHHVHLKELGESNWGASMVGTLQESLELFTGLRKAGVDAHSWV